jgi:hypothetical protein
VEGYNVDLYRRIVPATRDEPSPVISLRRVAAGNGTSSGGTYEIICSVCGDGPGLDHQKLPAKLQQIRGPYMLSAAITAFLEHDGLHRGPDDM